jgi:hypothetical protein
LPTKSSNSLNTSSDIEIGLWGTILGAFEGGCEMESSRKEVVVSVPEMALLAGTRALIGAGLGLLFATRLRLDQQKAVGWALFCVGALSSIPLGFQIFGKDRPFRASLGQAAEHSQARIM